MMKILPFSEVTKFHGHVCPGTAIGYRAGEIAIKKLGSSRAIDEELLAIVENDSCSVDAIQVITGCTMGKGNLIFKDYGKHVYTFVNRKSNHALRLSLKKDVRKLDSNFDNDQDEEFKKSFSSADKLKFDKQKEGITEKIMNMAENDLFHIEYVELDIPEKARIFNSLKCTKCGELVAEHRARIENGEIVCIPCFEDYSRN
jgi:formylmethanofuran dehydrogenase subunit E